MDAEKKLNKWSACPLATHIIIYMHELVRKRDIDRMFAWSNLSIIALCWLVTYFHHFHHFHFIYTTIKIPKTNQMFELLMYGSPCVLFLRIFSSHSFFSVHSYNLCDRTTFRMNGHSHSHYSFLERVTKSISKSQSSLHLLFEMFE